MDAMTLDGYECMMTLKFMIAVILVVAVVVVVVPVIVVVAGVETVVVVDFANVVNLTPLFKSSAGMCLDILGGIPR